MPENDQISEIRKLKRLIQLKRENGIRFYEPFPKQDSFHRNGHILRRYVRTGNRFGKSTLGAAEDCAWALGERPWYDKDDPARFIGIPKRPTKGLIIVADWDKAHEVFTNPVPGVGLGKLFKFLPKEKIRGKKTNTNGVISEINVECLWGGESTIMLDTVKSFKSNPMGQESSDWDWIHIDEPCPKPMWIANSRGLVDRGGAAWFTCTPINEPWINDMFLPRHAMRKQVEGAVMIDADHWMVSGNSYDNPHNTEKALKMFEKDLTEAEKNCRIKGLPLALSGLVYKEFDPEEHILGHSPHGWKDWLSPPEGYTIRVFIDPHPSTPHAVLFTATSPHGFTFYYHEIFRQCLIDDLCEMITAVLFGREAYQMIIDPAGFITNPIDGRCFADIFHEHGLFVEPGPKDLSNGILKTQAFLGRRKALSDTKSVPLCYFAPHLSETLWEFDHYEWSQTRPDKPVDRNDHMMENLYRSVMIGVEQYVAPSTTDDKTFIGYDMNYNRSLKIGC
jgi:hypothetical protein